MLTIKNNLLSATINPIGAELSALNATKNQNTFLWDADPEVWGSHAPNLFPIVGALKDDTYIYDGKSYHMPKHGFLRGCEGFVTNQKSETEVSFLLESSPTLYEIYPFLFKFEIIFKLEANTLLVNHIIKNTDTKPMFFSLGGHPAFKCPLENDEDYSDYQLKFEQPETSKSFKLNLENGLVTEKTKSVFNDPQTIKLRDDLFSEDALIFKDLNSRKVTLAHKENGDILSVIFKDFSYLGIWAKPIAPYVCIEPWLGIADAESSSQRIEVKEGIIALNAKSSFRASYMIEINQDQLI